MDKNAVASGSPTLVAWMCERGLRMRAEECSVAAAEIKCGEDAVGMFEEIDCRVGLRVEAAYRHVVSTPALKWLSGLDTTDRAAASCLSQIAVSSGSLEFLEAVVLDSTVSIAGDEIICAAARAANAQAFGFLRFLGFDAKDRTLLRWSACRGGDIGLIERLMREEDGMTHFESDCYSAAARGGHAHVLEWLEAKGVAGADGQCVVEAARSGCVRALRWALERHAEQGGPVTHEACCSTASIGPLDCLKLLVESGWPMHRSVCLLAAEEGHVDTIRWAVEEGGCEWVPEEVCEAAAGIGAIGVLAWARGRLADARDGWASASVAAWRGAVDRSRFPTLNWLLDGAPMPPVPKVWEWANRVDVLVWLARNVSAECPIEAAWRALWPLCDRVTVCAFVLALRHGFDPRHLPGCHFSV
jgi:hypothetical protein